HSHAAAAIIGNPMPTLNFCIQAPGLGKNLSHFGCQVRTRYGAAKPAPTVSMIRIVNIGFERTAANPTAGARKGAVQEVANRVVRSPLKKAPADPCLDASVLAAVSAPELSVIS